MKVYVVCSFDWDEFDIMAVFSAKEKADSFVLSHDYCSVRVLELDADEKGKK